ncbi:protein wech-like [Mytilus californianus]|uniref:protein wech-like n=1 Tax=Mytilus californianus TaxID=6549 RepID=UPI00224678FD|nr:protein wech-like [Mytilus californianus]
MSSKLTVCGVCEYRKINKPSVVWCLECDEGLCEECKEHHAASKGSRNHSIIPVSQYQKLPSNILEINQICPKHDEKYVIFCRKHDCPCCRRCVVETHNDCKEIDAIDDVIRNVKSSNAFLDIEQMLAELSGNLQRIRKDRQENIKSLIENRAKIENEIQQTRSLINNHLDKLQESLIKELYDVEEKESTKIKNIISSIQENERKILETQTTLGKIKQHASDLQTFLALKHIQRDVTNNEQFIESLIKEEKMNYVSMSWKKEKSVEILFTTVKKMGTIIILDTRSGDATLTNRKNKQAQIMVPITPVPNINDLKLTLRQTVKALTNDVTSCCLLPDGRMILSCYTNKKIYVLKIDGTLDFTLQPGFTTSHIHFIEESQKLVVTSGNYSSGIKIIDMKSRKTEKSISVGSETYGIAHKDGKLFYNGGCCGLRVVHLDNNAVTQLVKGPLSLYSSIAIWSNNLNFINNDSVTCNDLQGGIQWKFEKKGILQTARGITVDNYGRVYVSDKESNSIVVISPDGKETRLLLATINGLRKPTAVFFDQRSNKLLIANQGNDAFLYDVSK